MGSTGASNQLVLLEGAANTEALFKSDGYTLFRSTCEPIVPFAMCPVDLQVSSGTARCGSRATVQVRRSGDFLYHTWAKFGLPGIVGIKQTRHDDGTVSYELCENGEDGVINEPHYCNAVGFRILEQIQLEMGTIAAQTITHDSQYFAESLFQEPGKRLDQHVGRYATDEELCANARKSSQYYVPLQFFFTHHTNATLKLCALAYHLVHMHFQFARWDDLVEIPAHWEAEMEENPRVKYKVCYRPDNISTASLTGDRGSDRCEALWTTPIPQDLDNFVVEGNFCIVQKTERNKFQGAVVDQVFPQTQVQTVSINGTGASGVKNAQIPLNLSNACTAMMWGVHSHENLKRNRYFDYTAGKDADTGKDINPVDHLTIDWGGTPRVSREGSWYNLVQPAQHAKNIPPTGIGLYSFADEPADTIQCSGAANLSKLDRQHIFADINPRAFGPEGSTENTAVQFVVVATVQNSLRYKLGLSQVRFV